MRCWGGWLSEVGVAGEAGGECRCQGEVAIVGVGYWVCGHRVYGCGSWKLVREWSRSSGGWGVCVCS